MQQSTMSNTHEVLRHSDIKEEDIAMCLFGIGTNKQLLDKLDPHAVNKQRDLQTLRKRSGKQ